MTLDYRTNAPTHHARRARVGQVIVVLVAAIVLAQHLVLASRVPQDSVQQHARSSAWAISMAGVILLMLVLSTIAVGSWLVIAGTVGNLIGWLQTGSVPNYLTFTVGDRWVTYNLADLAIVTGAAMVVVAVAARAGGTSP